MNRSKIAALVFLLGVLLLPDLYAQQGRVRHWQMQRDNGTFVQGTYQKEVSAPPIELISLYDQLDRFEYNRGQSLYVTWKYPEEHYFFLKVQEKQILRYYCLESKPDSVRQLKTTLGPWKVDEVMGSINVIPTNLGVVLRMGSDDSRYYVPVSVYEGEPGEARPYYIAGLRLGRNVDGGTYKAYRGKFEGVPAAGSLVQEQRVGGHDAGSVLNLRLRKDALTDYRGWVTVVVSLNERGTFNQIEFPFYFYQH